MQGDYTTLLIVRSVITSVLRLSDDDCNYCCCDCYRKAFHELSSSPPSATRPASLEVYKSTSYRSQWMLQRTPPHYLCPLAHLSPLKFRSRFYWRRPRSPTKTQSVPP